MRPRRNDSANVAYSAPKALSFWCAIDGVANGCGVFVSNGYHRCTNGKAHRASKGGATAADSGGCAGDPLGRWRHSTGARRRGSLGYSISQAAKALGVSGGTIRRWSDIGRLETTRTPGGQRRFSQEQIDRFVGSLSPTPGSSRSTSQRGTPSMTISASGWAGDTVLASIGEPSPLWAMPRAVEAAPGRFVYAKVRVRLYAKVRVRLYPRLRFGASSTTSSRSSPQQRGVQYASGVARRQPRPPG